MLIAIRRGSALGAACLLITGVSACGGGIPSNSLAQVDGTPITKSTFEHWLSIAASSNAAAVPGQTAPKPVIPDPPHYKACIGHLEAIAPKPTKGQAKPSEKTLKTECEQQYTALKSEVLGFLIQANWLAGEAKEQGVKVSDDEVQKQFDTLKKEHFHTAEEFQKYLSSTGYTVSDVLLRTKLSMLSQKMEQKVTKNARNPVSEAEVSKYYNEHKSQFKESLQKARTSIQQTIAATRQQKSLSTFIKEFQKTWKGKTECRSEYVVADCKEYKTPKAGATAPTTSPQTQTGTTVTATVSTSTTKSK